MLKKYHVEIMRLALSDTFSRRALEVMMKANLKQDGLRGQIGHDEYHFDNNAFEKSAAYIEEQRALVISFLVANDVSSAWSAFGRLTHGVHDFYAHSNYIELWLAYQPEGSFPPPRMVDPLDPDLIGSAALRSGKVYVLEALTLMPILKPLVMPLLPRDSHAWMNIDSPEHGASFDYAFHAAIKRTKIEFERTTKNMPTDFLELFVDQ
jgi:hypothetical protein